MGYTEFGKYLINYRSRNHMIGGQMAQKLSMTVERLYDIQVGARITDEEFRMLTDKYSEVRIQMNILYHTIGLDRYDDSRIIDGKYYIYRNRFFAQGSQLNHLHILEKLGYLTRENSPKWYFKVTEKGFELLTDITGLKFEEEE